jgi:hypothetical protein
MGPFSSDSRSSSRTQRNEGPVTASQGTAQSTQQGGRSKSVSQGGINLEKGANIAGLTFGNIGKGATVTLTAPAPLPFDSSSLDRASDALENLVSFQADHTASAFQHTGNLGQPLPTTAATGPGSDRYSLIIALAGVFAVLLVALAILKRK